jgi:hypothetical protein
METIQITMAWLIDVNILFRALVIEIRMLQVEVVVSGQVEEVT